MIVRLAHESELPFLRSQLRDTDEVTLGRVWVAVEGDTIIGVLPLRLAWQAEPLMLLPSAKNLPKITQSRAALMMYLACEEWIASPLNRCGPKWLFAVTRSRRVIKWADRLRWMRIYKGATFFLKHLS